MNPDFTLFGLCLTSTLKKIAKISCLQLMKEFQIRFNHKAKRSNAKKFNFRRLPKSSPLNCWVEISYCSEIYFFLRQTQLRALYKNVPRSGWGPRQEKLTERRGVIPSSRVSSVGLTSPFPCVHLALLSASPKGRKTLYLFNSVVNFLFVFLKMILPH